MKENVCHITCSIGREILETLPVIKVIDTTSHCCLSRN